MILKKIVLACDLDNTIIHSYKTRNDGDICIEYIHGKEQGYMHPDTYKDIPELASHINIIPVTTRSIEQYIRLKWPDQWHPEYAITTNGAIFLHNTDVDDEWSRNSKEMVCNCMLEMNSLMEQLLKDEDYIRCRMVDDMYLFCYCKDGIEASEKTKQYSNVTGLKVEWSGKKIYFFPPMINKGSAISRLKNRLKCDYIISVGDSFIDIPMLNKADFALCKKKVYDLVENNKKVEYNEERSFSWNIWRAINSLNQSSN